MGNRELQVIEAYTNTYTYDEANRLTAVDSVGNFAATYTWDANGNLLDDGAKSYEYTSNKLSSVTGDNLNITYQYNGLGERVSQTVNGVTTHFTVDLNSGLSQVLADGTHSYLYGVERIAQESTNGRQYFLADALGSVSQLVDAEGVVILAKEFEPYGEVLSSAGAGVTSYGFGSEWTDSTGLISLRSRFYSPVEGRFVSRDSWVGDYGRPNSLNKWNYGYSNPVRYIDPSGEDPISECLALFAVLALADSPVVPVGDAAGIIACAAILGGSYITTVMAVQHAEELGQAVGTLADQCVSPMEWLYNLPEAPGEPDPESKPEPTIPPFPWNPTSPEPTPEPKNILYHYTSVAGLARILASQSILPSLADDVRATFGHGQYFTDISPIDASVGSAYQLSFALYHSQWLNSRVTNYVAINVSRLPMEQVGKVYSKTYGDRHQYLHRSELSLSILGRLKSSGEVNFLK